MYACMFDDDWERNIIYDPGFEVARQSSSWQSSAYTSYIYILHGITHCEFLSFIRAPPPPLPPPPAASSVLFFLRNGEGMGMNC